MMTRELDAKVAKALGWTNLHIKDMLYRNFLIGNKPNSVLSWDEVPMFSGIISDAWRLVELGGEFYLEHDGTSWFALFGDDLDDARFADTAAEAISEAYVAWAASAKPPTE